MGSFAEQVLAASLVVGFLLVAMAIVYYLFSYKNIKKRRQHFETLHRNLAAGQRVEFANGLIGKIKSVGNEVCVIELKSGALMEVSRFAISRRVDQSQSDLN